MTINSRRGGNGIWRKKQENNKNGEETERENLRVEVGRKRNTEEGTEKKDTDKER